MFAVLRRITRNLSTLLLAFALAVAMWITAVTSSDPTEERVYPRPVTLEVIGQDPGLLITSSLPSQINVTLSAPRSVWERLLSEAEPVRALADLSGLGPGMHVLPVQVQVGMVPVQVVAYSPRTLNVALEALASRTFNVRLIQRGEPATGFQAEAPVLSQSSAVISGPASLVNRVQEVRAILDIGRATENINRTLNLLAVDANDLSVNGLTINPDRITVSETILQRGGYRNVAIKVISVGKPANGYRSTNISVSPPVITVYSSDPRQVESMPGYVETAPIDISGVKDDLEVYPKLNLPQGVSVVGDQPVQVQIGVAAIEDSLTLSNMKVMVMNVPAGMKAELSPDRVDVLISGPLYLLAKLTPDDVKVVVDLNDEAPGVYQRIPRIEINIPELRVESVLPATIEVILSPEAGPTPSPTPKR